MISILDTPRSLSVATTKATARLRIVHAPTVERRAAAEENADEHSKAVAAKVPVYQSFVLAF
jgi:hypothetical protein